MDGGGMDVWIEQNYDDLVREFLENCNDEWNGYCKDRWNEENE